MAIPSVRPCRLRPRRYARALAYNPKTIAVP